MPLVFVHGVNVRDDEAYRQEVLLRNQLMLNVFFPLTGLSASSENLYDAFWGDLAPAHRPGNLYLPFMEPLSVKLKHLVEKVPPAELLPIDFDDSASLFDQMEVEEVETDTAVAPGGVLLKLLKSEPIRDVLDTLIAFANDEQGAEIDLEDHYASVSRMALRAVRFADKFKTMEAQQSWLNGVRTDEELLDRLAGELEGEPEVPCSSPEKQVAFKRSREALRKSRQWIRHRLQSARTRILTPAVQARLLARARVEAVRNRARATTTRLAARTLMHPARQFFHGRLANFIGDSFFYFGKRGTDIAPGPVPERILRTLEKADAARTAEDSKLIVVAHSMGGIVMCDLVSYFRTDLKIDCLVTVGSQFPLFADLCMFPGLDQSSLPIVKPANVENWVNIFDPNDFLGFAADQLFDGIVDVEYASGKIGVSTHADYFKFPSFYECMARALGPILAGSLKERGK